MSKETIKLLLEALGYVLTPHGGTRAHVWDSDEARFVVQAYKVLEEALAKQEQKRPQNCGTSYCSCIECVMDEQEQGEVKNEKK